MGKGDRRSRRGKIWRGTSGKTRPAKKKKKTNKPIEVSETKVEAATANIETQKSEEKVTTKKKKKE